MNCILLGESGYPVSQSAGQRGGKTAGQPVRHLVSLLQREVMVSHSTIGSDTWSVSQTDKEMDRLSVIIS